MRDTRPYTSAMWGLSLYLLQIIAFSGYLSLYAYNTASQIKIKNGYFDTVNLHLENYFHRL